MRTTAAYDANAPESSWPRQWPAPKPPTPDVAVVLDFGHDLAFFDPAPVPGVRIWRRRCRADRRVTAAELVPRFADTVTGSGTPPDATFGVLI